MDHGVRHRVPSYHTHLIGRPRLQALYRERMGGAIDRLPFPLLFTWGVGVARRRRMAGQVGVIKVIMGIIFAVLSGL